MVDIFNLIGLLVNSTCSFLLLFLFCYHTFSPSSQILNKLQSSHTSLYHKLCVIFTMLVPLMFVIITISNTLALLDSIFKYGLYNTISCPLFRKITMVLHYLALLFLNYILILRLKLGFQNSLHAYSNKLINSLFLFPALMVIIVLTIQIIINGTIYFYHTFARYINSLLTYAKFFLQ